MKQSKDKFNQIIQNLITDISIYKEDMEAYSTNYMNVNSIINMVKDCLKDSYEDLVILQNELSKERNKMKDIRVGVYETYKKRTIHAIKELNFDVEFRKDIVDEDYYCIIKTFYNGSNCEWYSPSFETFKECQKWATDKLKEGGWQVSYIK